MSKNILIIPDAHANPKVNPRRFTWLGKLIADLKPDHVVDLGDFADNDSLSGYDRGKASFEGRRYAKDIACAHEARGMVDRGMKGMARPPKLWALCGNHECVSPDTEILTQEGWKEAQLISMSDEVASFDAAGWISFALPKRITHHTNTPLLHLKGDGQDELVSDSHRFFFNDTLMNLPPGKYKLGNFRRSGNLDARINVSDDMLKVLTWTVCDGTIVRFSEGKKRIQFKLSLERKLERLKSILDTAAIPYTFRKANFSTFNKLQPYYITIYGEWARKIDELLDFKKEFPSHWKFLSHLQLRVVLEEIQNTDGGRHFNHLGWVTTNKHDADTIQLACITHGIPCYYTVRPPGTKSFPNGKPQYSVSIFDNGVDVRRPVFIEKAGWGPTVAIETEHGTLITRRNGKVNFTGNSRSDRYADEHPEMQGKISSRDFEPHAWEWVPFLTELKLCGISFSHYYPSGLMGRPIGGQNPAFSLLRDQLRSCVQGHNHLWNFCERTSGTRKIQCLTAGAYTEPTWNPAYAGPSRRLWWDGVTYLEDVKDGWASSIQRIHVSRLMREYK